MVLVFKVVSISSVGMTAVDPSSVVMLVRLTATTVRLAQEYVKTDVSTADANEDAVKHAHHAWSHASGTVNILGAQSFVVNHVAEKGVTSHVGNGYSVVICALAYAGSLVQLIAEFVTERKSLQLFSVMKMNQRQDLFSLKIVDTSLRVTHWISGWMKRLMNLTRRYN